MTSQMRRRASGIGDELVDVKVADKFPTAAEMGFDQEPFRLGKLSITVLGASGDLAKKETYPALLDLYAHGYIPPQTAIVGFARSAQTNEEFHAFLKEWLPKSFAGKMGKCAAVMDEFISRCKYFQGAYSKAEDFAKLNTTLEEEEAKYGTGYSQPAVTNRVFYFAIPPFAFLDAAKSIKQSAKSKTGFTRIIVEKPFGKNLLEAQELTRNLGALYDETEIFRMDHFLGYEIAQNLLYMRFANAFIDPIMNNQRVASVRISLKEDFGTTGRGGYFTEYGIIRDVIQNHLLQLLCLVAMESPCNLGGEIRDAKVGVLKSILPVNPEDVILGQFTAANGQPGFLDDDSIKEDAKETAKHCSTFAQIVLYIDNDRWRGVPFVIRAGKGLDESKCEVRVQFKENNSDKKIFKQEKCPRNELVMRISPNEAVYMKTNVKSPGLSQTIAQSELDLSYNERYAGVYCPLAYTRLILAGIRGEAESFVRGDELNAAWTIFSPLLEEIEGGKKEVVHYPFGSRGPPEADKVLPKYNIIYDREQYHWTPAQKQYEESMGKPSV